MFEAATGAVNPQQSLRTEQPACLQQCSSPLPATPFFPSPNLTPPILCAAHLQSRCPVACKTAAYHKEADSAVALSRCSSPRIAAMHADEALAATLTYATDEAWPALAPPRWVAFGWSWPCSPQQRAPACSAAQWQALWDEQLPAAPAAARSSSATTNSSDRVSGPSTPTAVDAPCSPFTADALPRQQGPTAGPATLPAAPYEPPALRRGATQAARSGRCC